jgi:hypothetical protein
MCIVCFLINFVRRHHLRFIQALLNKLGLMVFLLLPPPIIDDGPNDVLLRRLIGKSSACSGAR